MQHTATYPNAVNELSKPWVILCCSQESLGFAENPPGRWGWGNFSLVILLWIWVKILGRASPFAKKKLLQEQPPQTPFRLSMPPACSDQACEMALGMETPGNYCKCLIRDSHRIHSHPVVSSGLCFLTLSDSFHSAELYQHVQFGGEGGTSQSGSSVYLETKEAREMKHWIAYDLGRNPLVSATCT